MCGEDVYLVEEAGETTASEVFGLIIKGCLFCHLQPNPPPSYTMSCNRMKSSPNSIFNMCSLLCQAASQVFSVQCTLSWAHVCNTLCIYYILSSVYILCNVQCTLCIVQYTSFETNLSGDTMREHQSDAPSPEYSDDTTDRADGYFESS